MQVGRKRGAPLGGGELVCGYIHKWMDGRTHTWTLMKIIRSPNQTQQTRSPEGEAMVVGVTNSGVYDRI